MKETPILLPISILAAVAVLILFRVYGSSQPGLTVGVIPGPYAEVMRYVQELAGQEGLEFDILEYDDPERLNADLRSGRVDANSAQDRSSLDADNAAHGNDLAAVATTVTLPLGIYSRQLRSLKDLQPGAAVAISADPAARARALILLRNLGLVDFPETAGLAVKPADLTANRLALRFVELDLRELAEVPAIYPAVALTYPEAERLGLSPARDALAKEDVRSPYAGILAIRAADRGQPWVGRLIAAYQSEPVKNFILERFQDSVRRPW